MFILWIMVGVFLGFLGFAICASGGRADEILHIQAMESVLRRVILWHQDFSKEPFPEEEIKNVLRD